MAEVPDHLVPTDGLTNSYIAFEGIDAVDSGANVRFAIFNENRERHSTFSIVVAPTEKGTIDSLVAEAHRRMCDIVRQWLYELNQARQGYENR